MKIKNKMIPCVDCITFPICKSKVISSSDPKVAILFLSRDKCSLIYKYLFSSIGVNENRFLKNESFMNIITKATSYKKLEYLTQYFLKDDKSN